LIPCERPQELVGDTVLGLERASETAKLVSRQILAGGTNGEVGGVECRMPACSKHVGRHACLPGRSPVAFFAGRLGRSRHTSNLALHEPGRIREQPDSRPGKYCVTRRADEGAYRHLPS
jgi:hypothetical protein